MCSKLTVFSTVLFLSLVLASCGTVRGDRAITGGLIGAGLGGIGGPGTVLLGAAIGTSVGVIVPAKNLYLGEPFWKTDVNDKPE